MDCFSSTRWCINGKDPKLKMYVHGPMGALQNSKAEPASKATILGYALDPWHKKTAVKTQAHAPKLGKLFFSLRNIHAQQLCVSVFWNRLL